MQKKVPDDKENKRKVPWRRPKKNVEITYCVSLNKIKDDYLTNHASSTLKVRYYGLWVAIFHVCGSGGFGILLF